MKTTPGKITLTTFRHFQCIFMETIIRVHNINQDMLNVYRITWSATRLFDLNVNAEYR